MGAEIHVGLFGKVPNLGDFVERRIHPGFRTFWDRWLQDCLTASQRELGEQWLDTYLVSPVWSFVISPDVCGDAVYAGVMVPSVDRVGRYFPLTVVATLAPETACLSLLAEGRAWFKAAESTLRDVLEGKITDIDEIDRTIDDLQHPLAELAARLAPRTAVERDVDLLLLLGRADQCSRCFGAVLEPLLATDRAARTFWLTDGSEVMSARLLAVRGLPQDTMFAAMLGGNCDRSIWYEVAPAISETAELTSPSRRQVASSVRTDRGHVRTRNEDYAAVRPDLGLWMVADGMGGYEDGALASAAACDAVENIDVHGTLAQKVDGCIASLRSVNDQLRVESREREQSICSASTVVLLIVDTDQWACVWAGDSRLYRLRADELEQISRDHATGQRSAQGPDAEEYFVTAGVGVEDDLSVDVLYGDLQVGDRFLLCSDGLYEGADEAAIVRALSHDHPRGATHELMRTVLDGPARDNLTAVAVFIG